MTDIIDDAAEQRWSDWKSEGARRDLNRSGRMQKLFIALVIAPVLWLIWRV